MVKAFFALSCLLAAVLTISIVKLNKNKHGISRSIQYLFAMAAVTVMCNAAAVITMHEGFSTLFHGLYFAATDWLVICLLSYTAKYTALFQNWKAAKYIIYAGAVLDTCSMFFNTFFRHVFSCEPANVYNWGECYVTARHTPVYSIHLFYVYGVVLLVLFILALKTMRTIRLYRKKYEVVLWSFISILAVNIGYRFINLPIDLSPIMYIGLAFAVAYFTLFYVPKGIMAKLLSFSIEDMESGIICFDIEGRCVYANDRARRLFGSAEYEYSIEEYFSKWKAKTENKYSMEERSSMGNKYSMESQPSTGNSGLKACVWQEKHVIDGETCYFEARFKPLLDSAGNYVGGFFAIEDRTEEIRKLERERFRATHDSLTGVYNRERFFERTRQLIDEDPDKKRYMVCSDIKDFKMVNELFGEQKGNEVLRETASSMQKEASGDTVFGRLGSDRFAMCISVENFHEEIFTEYVGHLKSLATNSVYRMHMHVGVYLITDPSMEVSVMCDRALVAIQRIKDNYQQVVVYYDDKLGKALQNEKTMIGEFDRALEEGQFHMFLQPQVSVDKKLLGAEALVRWIHPEKGMVPPGEFISLFEKCSYIHRLDRYVWELACRQLSQWKKEGREDLHISVNISPKDFYFVNIYETFTSLVEQYGINPRNLKLEITETALMTELNQQLNLLDKLRNYGFHIEIDDFGSGYSSLNMLKDIAVDVIKLDMGFLRRSEHEDKGRTIMNAIISLSKQLGLSVITEGVETAEQVEYLTGSGCDMFQGYYFAKPMPVADFEEKYCRETKMAI